MHFKFIFSEDEMTALIVGGWDVHDGHKTTELFSQGGTCSNNSLPSLPPHIYGPSLVYTSEEEILLCGGDGNIRKCLELRDNQWKEHSNLKND